LKKRAETASLESPITNRLDDCCITPGQSLREAIALIDCNCKGIVLVVDPENRLLGTLTDGDVRRALLTGRSLETTVADLLAAKVDGLYPTPITAQPGLQPHELLQILQRHDIHQLPLVDGDGRIVDLIVLDDLLPHEALPVQAIIMAGGKGTRLHPITQNVPKVMLPIGDRPILEHIVAQLRSARINRISVATHHLSEQIKHHFGDGRRFGVSLDYVSEESPLGTAGALALLSMGTEPLLVINGDILTEVDFRAMLSYHREHKADITVAVRQFDVQVPYGVIQSDGVLVTDIQEKPVFNLFVNAGIYLLEPIVHQHIPKGRRFDMTDLIHHLLSQGRPVASFPVVEYWLDIGQHKDYEQAQKDIQSGKFGGK